MGQRKCGHQIGVACADRGWQHWVLGDADVHKDRISLLHVWFPSSWKQRWWHAWKHLVHVTKFGPGYGTFCPLSPHNVPNNALDAFLRAGGTAGRASSS